MNTHQKVFFTAAVALGLVAGAFASNTTKSDAKLAPVELPRVEIVGHRMAPEVALEPVVIVGHRAAMTASGSNTLNSAG